MNLSSCLKLANFAKNNPSLLPNHISNGVVSYIKKELEDIRNLLKELERYPDEDISSLLRDESLLLDALKVYENG